MSKGTMLPFLVILVIGFVTAFVISSSRSNAIAIVGDPSYPHHVCETNRYCEGETCTDDPVLFIAYLAHANGQPRLEFPGFAKPALLIDRDDRVLFESTGGRIEGFVSILPDRSIDVIGTAGTGAESVAVYASGRCDRLIDG